MGSEGNPENFQDQGFNFQKSHDQQNLDSTTNGLNLRKSFDQQIEDELAKNHEPLPQIIFSPDDYWIKDSNKATNDNAHAPKLVQTRKSETESKSFTKRQLLIFVVYTFTQFSTGAVISLQAPFYPAEAEKKGLTATEYGIVFGIFEFTVFVISLVYGKYMYKFGPKRVYNLGLLTLGITSLLFGTLTRLNGRTAFFALSMVVRIMEAIAAGACYNAAFTIVAIEFPKSIATTFATFEMVLAFGLTCGPIIGGALYDLGGYSLPFYFVGVLLICTAIFVHFVLPTPVDLNAEVENTKGILDLIRIPEVIVSILAIFAAALTIGHLASTLEPHIRIFELSSVAVGLVIVISGASYAVVSPIWGQLCDRKPMMTLYMLIGCVITIFGFLLIGPAPFLPIDKVLWVMCVGLVLHGIGVGGTLVPPVIQCLASAKEYEFPDNTATYALASGIWTSLFSLGNFVGPTVSGILYDAVGFRNGTFFVIGLEILVIIALIVVMCFSKKPAAKNSTTNELI